jgi:hypothetical protein
MVHNDTYVWRKLQVIHKDNKNRGFTRLSITNKKTD